MSARGVPREPGLYYLSDERFDDTVYAYFTDGINWYLVTLGNVALGSTGAALSDDTVERLNRKHTFVKYEKNGSWGVHGV